MLLRSLPLSYGFAAHILLVHIDADLNLDASEPSNLAHGLDPRFENRQRDGDNRKASHQTNIEISQPGHFGRNQVPEGVPFLIILFRAVADEIAAQVPMQMQARDGAETVGTDALGKEDESA